MGQINHPLHEKLGELLERDFKKSDGFDVYLDPACGGGIYLPIFLGADKSRANRMCCVDALVVAKGEVRLIVEIEESNTKPTQIAGKLFTSALGEHFSHPANGRIPLSRKHLFFLHILDSSKLEVNSDKVRQGGLIEERFQKWMRNIEEFPISEYKLHYTKMDCIVEDWAEIADSIMKTLNV